MDCDSVDHSVGWSAAQWVESTAWWMAASTAGHWAVMWDFLRAAPTAVLTVEWMADLTAVMTAARWVAC